MSDTIIWISGATDGLGLGIARNTPYKDARIINISRRQHPDYETFIADLSDPADWERIRAHFKTEFAVFRGKRAIFINNAYYASQVGMLGHVPADDYVKGVLVNGAAPQVLGEAYLSAAGDIDCEVGLCLLSTGATTMPILGLAQYSACKIAVEYWAQTAHAELEHAGKLDKRWVVAFRPGGIKTPGAKTNEGWTVERWPFVEIRREMGKDFMDIDTAGKRIWSGLPPKPEDYLLSLSPKPMTEASDKMFGNRVTVLP